METTVTITAEQKRAIEQAGDVPVVGEDPESHASYVILKQEAYRRLARVVAFESIDPSFFEYGEFVPRPG